MKEKLTFKDYMIYIIPGYIWITTILLTLNLWRDGITIINQFTIACLGRNLSSAGYAIISLPLAFITGNIFVITPKIISDVIKKTPKKPLEIIIKVITKIIPTKPPKKRPEEISKKIHKKLKQILVLDEETEVDTDKNIRKMLNDELEFNIPYDRFNRRIEYMVDDILSIKGIRNSWSRYHDLAHLMKHTYTSGIFLTFPLVIHAFQFRGVGFALSLLIVLIIILSLCRLRYIHTMKNYITEIQLSYLISKRINTADNANRGD